MRLREMIFVKNRLYLNMTGDEEGLKRLTGAAGKLLDVLPVGTGPAAPVEQVRHAAHIGIAIPAQVCYVTKVLAAPSYLDPLSAALFVLARQLSNGYLYRHIRVQGGAYGGSCRYEPLGGLFAFISYRDPHLAETLAIYRDAVESLIQKPVTQEELEKAVIGAIGALDRPLDPAGRGYTALIREFSHLNDSDRLHFREEVLGITPERLQQTARCYFPQAEEASIVAVCAAEEHLKKANEILKEKLILERLP
jgi:Zn-dependent M16 (insulinase) family peptidase